MIGSGGGGTGSRQQNQRARLSSGGLGSAQTSIGSGESRAGIARQAAGSLSSVVAEADGLRITADPATNSVIIIGSRRDYESIKTVIEELDIR
ncbi:MAG: type II secretion system protein GspD, partial [Gammaproteobacteria bacterium]|nr:type II secretion system protein GspD [Gammaproteobacteria bacterium]NIW44160.1 type II secretion system protein GspD [Gammaproteobacteria bacterium]NIX55264.1 type II secretion system protein GspD [candidate division Zixibacteria bacterium]